MGLLGGVLGAVVGFLAGILITEVIFSNPARRGGGFDWHFWVDILLTIIGAVAGRELGRRRKASSTPG